MDINNTHLGEPKHQTFARDDDGLLTAADAAGGRRHSPCEYNLYRWRINPPTDSGPTYYIVMETDTEAARTKVLTKCRPDHRDLVASTGPRVVMAGDVITI